MLSAELWAQERNLQLPGGRETLIYLLGRAFRENLPSELLVYLTENLHTVAREQEASKKKQKKLLN